MNLAFYNFLNQYNKFDFSWLTTLFATAIGAGVLFLPINAGLYGMWPLLIIATFTIPMTYLSHRALSYIVLFSQGDSVCLNDIIRKNFSSTFTKLFGALYFFATFPLLLIYGLGLTNTISTILATQLHLLVPRVLLSFIIVSALFSAIIILEEKIKILIQYLAMPLSLILLLLSVYLIPHWNLSMLSTFPKTTDFIKIIWLTLPIIVFTFNFSPAISAFAHAYKKHTNREQSIRKVENILKSASGLLFFFVMFFVCSCILSLHPSDLMQAISDNISVLSYMALAFHDPFLAIINSFIAIIAMLGAFFGTYFGCREATRGIVKENLISYNNDVGNKCERTLNVSINCFLFVSILAICILNTNIVDFISMFCGPIIAVILFIFPMYATYKMKDLQTIRSKIIVNRFLITIGFITLSAIFYSLKSIF